MESSKKPHTSASGLSVSSLFSKEATDTPHYSLYEQRAKVGKVATRAFDDFSNFLGKYVDPEKQGEFEAASHKANSYITTKLSDIRNPDEVFTDLMGFQESRAAMISCLKADMKTNRDFLSEYEPKLVATQLPVEAISNLSFWIFAASRGQFNGTTVDDAGEDTMDIVEFWGNVSNAKNNTKAQEEATTIFNHLVRKEKERDKDPRSNHTARSSR